MGFEIKVALLIWHSHQTQPFTPQSTISVEPSLVSAFVIDRPNLASASYETSLILPGWTIWAMRAVLSALHIL
jgi:hypothetical protein